MSVQMEGAKLSARLIGALILATVIGVLLAIGGAQVNTWRKAAAQNEHRGRVLDTTTGIIGDAGKVEAARKSDEGSVASARDTYQHVILEQSNANPDLRASGSTPVPSGVRDALRARRLARERLGHVESDGPSRAGAADPPER